jgi:hypothetical protein
MGLTASRAYQQQQQTAAAASLALLLQEGMTSC